MRPTVYSSLTTLWKAQDEDGNYVKDNDNKEIYTDQSEIHRMLLERNATHLSQASSTPFATGDLQKALRWDGTGPLADSMLTGNILNDRRFD